MLPEMKSLKVRGLRRKPRFCVVLHPLSLRHTVSTPHSSVSALLEFEASYFAIESRFLAKLSGSNDKKNHILGSNLELHKEPDFGERYI